MKCSYILIIMLQNQVGITQNIIPGFAKDLTFREVLYSWYWMESWIAYSTLVKKAIEQDSINNRREEEFNKWLQGSLICQEERNMQHIFSRNIGDNSMFEFNGNIRNFGLIDNLPEGCCVEVPIVASKAGLRLYMWAASTFSYSQQH